MQVRAFSNMARLRLPPLVPVTFVMTMVRIPIVSMARPRMVPPPLKT